MVTKWGLIIMIITIIMIVIVVIVLVTVTVVVIVIVMIVIVIVINGDRKGTDGVSTNGFAANLMLFDRVTFWVLPLTEVLSSQKCQGVPFSPICQNLLLLQRPH